mmetsp:Transcript_15396/g.31451  ORF Transcript_15396/g.31451 Transcript_15396/m.31451 type:complete len:195 (-) Transcript_15396:278-862(-)
MALSKVTLPTGKLGIKLVGSPPVITSVADDSPIAHLVKQGHVVEKVIIPEMDEISDLDANALRDVLAEKSEVEGRILVVKESSPPPTSSSPGSPQPPVSISNNRGNNPPPGGKPGGEWMMQQYTGSKTQAAACVGCLCFCLPGLLILCCPLDKRYVYQEPGNGRLLDGSGKVLAKDSGNPPQKIPPGYMGMNRN